jgi:septum formation protein
LGVQPGRLILASTSPRRRELLARLGYGFEVIDPCVEDGDLSPGTGHGLALAHWVASLSYLKAVAGARQLARSGRALDGLVLIGADTLVDVDGRVLTKPTSESDAAEMIRLVRGRAHEVLTGVTILHPHTGLRDIFTDRAEVVVGSISDAQIDAYVRSGEWRGKAGGYNLSERQRAGWPMFVQGDASTVMGLPVQRLGERLARFCAGRVALARAQEVPA